MDQTNDYFIVKMRAAGLSPEVIGKKMGIPPEEVDAIYAAFVRQQLAKLENGYGDLTNHFNMFCQQYSNLGESLKVFGYALSNLAEISEVADLIDAHVQQHGKELTTIDIAGLINSSFIVLRPFKPVTPEEALQQVLEKN